MTEPQFSYSELTLDELRSMAASPQVGSMQAMPQSFHALADRVGEVADLLSHAQADLPNWWKGPAAEQAAATLGRAAAEAREFHGSALAAASAVSRCAQVVAEQQHQMMNVPDVAEPGVTAVVQRPATPFEALEAARQDASYQAAHQQAVQTVNGIAAQYVETHGQLSNITTMFGEDFTPVEESRPLTPVPDILHGNPTPSTPSSKARSSQLTGHQAASSSLSANAVGTTPRKDQLSTTFRSIDHSSSRLNPHEVTTSHEFESDSNDFVGAHTSESHKGLGGTQKVERGSSSSMTHQDPATIANTEPGNLLEEKTPTKALRQPIPEDGVSEGSEIARARKLPVAAASTPNSINTKTRIAGKRPLADISENVYAAEPAGSENFRATPQTAYQSGLDEVGDNSAAIVPPYGSLGSVHRTRQERNPRPAYLKERKSAWLSETAAAPADGVIRLDWPEQH
ncbi:hypothetical protein Caci_7879 [Catenulispora acidiphila DSM 44928]|uniref:PPE family domain-containing protein n=1 Tax=Catenulispora acidiphila (strain DSM 44928 / JCM 14897 / NBRC 102108 / NRRL B-24433 / ID139908) TaxID=479433 RepID=C7QFC5_CATAD|nr:hypothetical protein [Catenulispora acidiphila]ACU76702.1 hypothetical protein Caci_7879 [Catenulispora acidiphila DSM 44928]